MFYPNKQEERKKESGIATGVASLGLSYGAAQALHLVLPDMGLLNTLIDLGVTWKITPMLKKVIESQDPEKIKNLLSTLTNKAQASGQLAGDAVSKLTQTLSSAKPTSNLVPNANGTTAKMLQDQAKQKIKDQAAQAAKGYAGQFAETAEQAATKNKGLLSKGVSGLKSMGGKVLTKALPQALLTRIAPRLAAGAAGAAVPGPGWVGAVIIFGSVGLEIIDYILKKSPEAWLNKAGEDFAKSIGEPDKGAEYSQVIYDTLHRSILDEFAGLDKEETKAALAINRKKQASLNQVSEFKFALKKLEEEELELIKISEYYENRYKEAFELTSIPLIGNLAKDIKGFFEDYHEFIRKGVYETLKGLVDAKKIKADQLDSMTEKFTDLVIHGIEDKASTLETEIESGNTEEVINDKYSENKKSDNSKSDNPQQEMQKNIEKGRTETGSKPSTDKNEMVSDINGNPVILSGKSDQYGLLGNDSAGNPVYYNPGTRQTIPVGQQTKPAVQPTTGVQPQETATPTPAANSANVPPNNNQNNVGQSTVSPIGVQYVNGVPMINGVPIKKPEEGTSVIPPTNNMPTGSMIRMNSLKINSNTFLFKRGSVGYSQLEELILKIAMDGNITNVNQVNTQIDPKGEVNTEFKKEEIPDYKKMYEDKEIQERLRLIELKNQLIIELSKQAGGDITQAEFTPEMAQIITKAIEEFRRPNTASTREAGLGLGIAAMIAGSMFASLTWPSLILLAIGANVLFGKTIKDIGYQMKYNALSDEEKKKVDKKAADRYYNNASEMQQKVVTTIKKGLMEKGIPEKQAYLDAVKATDGISNTLAEKFMEQDKELGDKIKELKLINTKIEQLDSKIEDMKIDFETKKSKQDIAHTTALEKQKLESGAKLDLEKLKNKNLKKQYEKGNKGTPQGNKTEEVPAFQPPVDESEVLNGKPNLKLVPPLPNKKEDEEDPNKQAGVKFAAWEDLAKRWEKLKKSLPEQISTAISIKKLPSKKDIEYFEILTERVYKDTPQWESTDEIRRNIRRQWAKKTTEINNRESSIKEFVKRIASETDIVYKSVDLLLDKDQLVVKFNV